MREVDNLLPKVPFYYLADSEFMPYGNKGPEEIIKRSSLLVEELIEIGCRYIIVACNTATALAIDNLRQKYPDILFIGVEPYVNIINKMPQLEKPVLLLTESISKSERFIRLKNAKDPHQMMEVFPCKNLATLAEKVFYEGINTSLIKALEEELLPLKGRGHTHAILGCTHYNFLRRSIADFLKVECVCPGDHVAKRVNNLIKQSFEERPSLDGFYFKNILQKKWQYWPKNDLSKVLAYD